jgi:hypothetical protein
MAWFIVSGEVLVREDKYREILIVREHDLYGYDKSLREFKELFPTATCINADLFSRNTASSYNVCYVLTERTIERE